jgi:hypothetical protein
MNDLLEGNFNNNRKQITGTDLLFNKNKISNEVASLSSSLSSLSSQSSNHSLSRKIKKPIYNNEDYEEEVVRPKIKIHKPVIQNNDDDDDDEEEEDDDDEEEEDDDDDEEEEDDDEMRSNASENSEVDLVKNRKNELNEKKEILYQLNRLESKGYKIPGSFSMQTDINELRHEYDRIVRDKDVDTSIRFQRKMLMAFVTGTEYLNSRYDPFAIKLEGWSEQVHENITDFDDIFEELHDKYKAKGKKMPPELRLFISLTGSAFMFHLTSKMFKESSIPGVEEVFKANPELMKQFQSAAAKQFIYKNTGIEAQEKPNQNNTGAGGQGLFGMIGNLFGGLSNTPAFNNSPKMPTMNKDIRNDLSNIHNKISPNLDEDNRIETLSISDEEITSIIEDATDISLLKKSVKGKNKRTLNI